MVAGDGTTTDPIYTQLVAERGDAIAEAQQAAEGMRQVLNRFREIYPLAAFPHVPATPWSMASIQSRTDPTLSSGRGYAGL